MNVKTIGTIIAAAVVLAAVPGLVAQTPPMPPHQMTDQMKMPSADMAAKCKAMMAEHAKMAADMKVADQKLDGLVTKMNNNASASTKLAATAAVVNELVTQRHSKDAGMMKMHQGTMTHMMEHMTEGKDSMAMCPMMKHK
jgi:hypothetical protein